jgi:hypothetical protein
MTGCDKLVSNQTSKGAFNLKTCSPCSVVSWTPLNLTVRVGCGLAYETTVPTPVLFVLRPRLEGRAGGAGNTKDVNIFILQKRLSTGRRTLCIEIGLA